MNELPFVVVAMSGGVDSSVAAALMVKRGYRVVGMMLRLWSEPGSDQSNRCCTPDAMAQARKIAQQLDIPFYAVDVRQRFRNTVVQSFLDGYSSGITPNPCVVCNQRIRWGALYEQARAMGAGFLATGHYARVVPSEDGSVRLLKGVDPAKDQSYVLSVLTQDQLAHSLFPLGELHKTEVRSLARDFGLTVADRPESQDLCFLAGEDYRSFLERLAPDSVRPGKIVDVRGNVVGEHAGLAFYTIGQRKSLRIQSSRAMYVVAKRIQKNEIVVGEKADLGTVEMVVEQPNWIARHPPVSLGEVQVKIRYKAQEIPACLSLLPDGNVRVQFKRPVRDVTPGQRAVFYDGDNCLGGGMILDGEDS